MAIKTVLVTGSKGQLGNEIQVLSASYPQFDFIFTDVDELDICNQQAVDTFFAAHKIDFLLNCAAYTAVDKAEEDVELSYLINEKALGFLGKAAVRYGVKIVHVSTDYVFDGKSYLPYTEDMPVCPATVYGKSKLAGEQLLKDVCPGSVIVRTSWLYSSFGNNFVKTMIRLGRERDSLNVIFDQVGTPTYAADLADALLQVISADKCVPGIYHYSNEGVCSWYDFTISIHKIAGINCRVLPIESKDYPAKTPRPHYSVLNKSKIKSVYNIQIPHWEDGLQRCMTILADK
ncbi:MAG: dTDP-4-dehydrorhamnose reductase [Paludibacter sp.]|nr:dTDP-4-dehydrorhamnose reductase [Paludibacter sp.]MDD4199191.1 dTDP-4-dehydrorhamnose reductase [Paludibacter sp.]MDD4426835.1 dTDP-4-dehydrorhamnose reductase [Paludibacter sp.]